MQAPARSGALKAAGKTGTGFGIVRSFRKGRKHIMASFSTLSDIDLEKQVAALSRELAALRKVVSRRGGAYYEDGRDAASDYYSDIAERFSDALPAIRRQGRAIEKTARDHPATAAAVGLVVVGLVASLFLSRQQKTPRATSRSAR
jgi:ElaB/YqjD/DUF883 family membrane-anchored ribosome-binding protein